MRFGAPGPLAGQPGGQHLAQDSDRSGIALLVIGDSLSGGVAPAVPGADEAYPEEGGGLDPSTVPASPASRPPYRSSGPLPSGRRCLA